jgi:hypothetical protein
VDWPQALIRDILPHRSPPSRRVKSNGSGTMWSTCQLPNRWMGHSPWRSDGARHDTSGPRPVLHVSRLDPSCTSKQAGHGRERRKTHRGRTSGTLISGTPSERLRTSSVRRSGVASQKRSLLGGSSVDSQPTPSSLSYLWSPLSWQKLAQTGHPHSSRQGGRFGKGAQTPSPAVRQERGKRKDGEVAMGWRTSRREAKEVGLRARLVAGMCTVLTAAASWSSA